MEMTSYLILLSGKEPSVLTNALLKAHIEYLQTLRKKRILQVCGPCKDNKKSILILSTENYDKALELICNDPFIKEKYYKSYEIYEFDEAKDENEWLMNSEQSLNNLESNNITTPQAENKTAEF